MSRPKAFDVDKALDRAMQAFWSKGYEATSMSDLTAAMGLSKSSLYETFGSKHDLFLAAIDRYTRTVASQITGATQIKAPARKIIRALFERAVVRLTEPESRRGCFLNNTAVELGARDDAAAAKVTAGLAVMEKTFLELVERGQREGSVSVRHDAKALARFLTASLNGIMVMGKANPNPVALHDMADVAVAALD